MSTGQLTPIGFTLSLVFAGLLLVSKVPVLAAQGGTTVIGSVSFHGVVPPNKVIKVMEDPRFCGTTVTIQPVKRESGNTGLQQAVVSIHGLKGNSEIRHRTNTLTNQQCEFIPRVSAGMRNSGLEIRNNDPILHNTHGKIGKRTVINVAQVAGGRPLRKKMKRPGLIELQCDKHEFMKGYLMVFDHPFFAVTDNTGQFQISGVPAGHYPVLVWHETLGILEKEITIPAQGTVTIKFEYP